MEYALLGGAMVGAIGIAVQNSVSSADPPARPDFYMSDNGDRNCEVTSWSDWTGCDFKEGECGQGGQLQTRTVYREPIFLGEKCPPLTETKACYRPCPVDCSYNDWTDWGVCVPKEGTCGDGVRTKTLPITTEAKYGGKECPVPIVQTESCTIPCDCRVTDWSEWTECKSTIGDQCGTTAGSQNRSRIVERMSSFGGTPCPVTMAEERICEIRCPQDCKTNRVEKEVPCIPNTAGVCGSGKGTSTYNLEVESPAQFGGKVCGATETESCDVPCPEDCTFHYSAEWSTCRPFPDSKCDKENGMTKGYQYQEAIVDTPARYGGTCDPPDMKRDCSTPCNVDCEFENSKDEWDMFECIPHGKNNCGAGVKKRPITITQTNFNAGKACPTDLFESKECEVPCPVDCETSDWNHWSTCSNMTQGTCGKGTRSRDRTKTKDERNGGKCFPLTETEECEFPCPVDCMVSEWSAWGSCELGNKTCGDGIMTRARTIETDALHGGRCEFPLSESKACNVPCEPQILQVFSGNGNSGNSGGAQTWTSTLTGVVRVIIAGAQGGRGDAGPGGMGSHITCDITVGNGQVFTIYTGRKGEDVGSKRSGGGGGGGSAIVFGNVPIVVAGGGGGTATNEDGAGRGGNGGTPNGSPGSGNFAGEGGVGGRGGNGGSGYRRRGNDGSGPSPQGGNGGNSVGRTYNGWKQGGWGYGTGGMGLTDHKDGASGGGGGGYSGGGSGGGGIYGGAGGGGSSYVNPTLVSNIQYSTNEGDGSITISTARL